MEEPEDEPLLSLQPQTHRVDETAVQLSSRVSLLTKTLIIIIILFVGILLSVVTIGIIGHNTLQQLTKESITLTDQLIFANVHIQNLSMQITQDKNDIDNLTQRIINLTATLDNVITQDNSDIGLLNE